MKAIRCPACNRIYLPEEIDSEQCPKCRAPLGEAGRAVLAASTAAPPARTKARGPWILPAMLAIPLLIAAVMLWLNRPGSRNAPPLSSPAASATSSLSPARATGLQPANPAPRPAELLPPIAAKTPEASSRDASAPEPAPSPTLASLAATAAQVPVPDPAASPADAVADPVTPAAPATSISTVPAEPEQPATPAAELSKPVASVLEAEPPPQVIPAREDEVLLNQPDGVYRVPSLDTGESRELAGRIKRLEIEMVNGDAWLDAAELQAQEVVFVRGVNGQAQVRVFAPEGRVELQGDINGEAVVDIYAPGGQVVLGKDGNACVNGSGRITITAATVDIRGRVDGSPRLEVTLSPGGKLKFAELSGSARLTYRRASPMEPEPVIEAGLLRAGAQFIEADPNK